MKNTIAVYLSLILILASSTTSLSFGATIIDDSNCTITTDTTWTAAGSPYLVNSSISIGNNATLTIENSVFVMFDAGKNISISTDPAGALFADTVTFTSQAAAPMPGDWGLIDLGENDLGSLLTNCTIEYGNLLGLSGYSATVTACTIRNNLSGPSIGGGASTLSGCTIENNDGNGLVFFNTSNATITDNTIRNNDGYAVYAQYPDNLPYLDTSNIFTGNTHQAVSIEFDCYIDTSRTWGVLGLDYLVKSIRIENNAVLKLEGCTLKFLPGSSFELLSGALIADGVTFTSQAATPMPGDWNGIYLDDENYGSQLTDCIIEYGTGTGIGESPSSLLNCTIRNNLNGVGIGGDTPTVSGCTIENNLGDGLSFREAFGATITDNIVRNNAGYAVQGTCPHFLPALDKSNSFVANGQQVVFFGFEGYIENDHHWIDLGLPYLVNNIQVYDGATFTLEGCTLKFSAGSTMDVTGVLVADKTTFTSQSATPAPGDWDYIRIRTDTGTSQLTDCTIEYGSYIAFEYASPALMTNCNIINNLYGLGIADSSPTISDCIIENNGMHGVTFQGRSPALFSCNTVMNNAQHGIYIIDPAAPIITANNISGNGSFDLSNESWESIDAGLNWWGTTVNPADLIDNNGEGAVVYEPWRTYGSTCTISAITSDMTGSPQHMFESDQNVYGTARTFLSPATAYALYLVDNSTVTWNDGLDLTSLSRTNGTDETFTTDSNGNMAAGTLLWAAADLSGDYAVVIDADNDGRYYADNDFIDTDLHINTPPSPDSDSDGIPDTTDNCPLVPNHGQEDNDLDGTGNTCDNCPTLCNSDQLNADNDTFGDACDAIPECGGCSQPTCGQTCADDTDGDYIQNDLDNCSDIANADQTDTDLDGRGNACDNCPNNCNTAQADVDKDGEGDVCDTDPGCGGCGPPCEQECQP
ncbi:MAG: hypothetical protein GY850_06965 [bacterium]|nr:hypothetical protein [bacterium]